jgi:hypothetical protein
MALDVMFYVLSISFAMSSAALLVWSGTSLTSATALINQVLAGSTSAPDVRSWHHALELVDQTGVAAALWSFPPIGFGTLAFSAAFASVFWAIWVSRRKATKSD